MASPSRILSAACGCFALLLAIGPLARAAEPAARPLPSNDIGEQALEQNYLVFPVTTDLQRAIAGFVPRNGENLKAFVALNGALLLDEAGQFVPNALNADAIRRALEPLKDAEHGVVQLTPYFHALTKSNKAFDDQAVKYLQDVGKAAGFHRACVISSWGWSTGLEGDAWRNMITAVADADGRTPDAEEPAVGNDAVKVYRVWTFMSRLLSGNSDCVVDVPAPFTDAGAEALTAKIWETVKTEVENINLDSRERIQFRIMAPNVGAVAIPDAHKARDDFRRKESHRLARAVGFKNWTTSLSSY